MLPSYITVIHHGHSRLGNFSRPIVALPLSRVMKRRGVKDYGRIIQGSAALRQEFGLRPDSQVLLLSVGHDKHLENYWRYRNTGSYDAATQIAGLNVIGVTIPNFSFFMDAPKPHILWNRGRMTKVAEELSGKGVPVIPHLNALTQENWNFWELMLKEQPQIRHVTKEFQTGLAIKQHGREAVDALLRLQDSVGRDFHPIIIGGEAHLAALRSGFAQVTLIDSSPFMRSIMRRTLEIVGGVRRWRRIDNVLEGRTIDHILERNIDRYERWLLDHADGQL